MCVQVYDTIIFTQRQISTTLAEMSDLSLLWKLRKLLFSPFGTSPEIDPCGCSFVSTNKQLFLEIIWDLFGFYLKFLFQERKKLLGNLRYQILDTDAHPSIHSVSTNGMNARLHSLLSRMTSLIRRASHLPDIHVSGSWFPITFKTWTKRPWRKVSF